MHHERPCGRRLAPIAVLLLVLSFAGPARAEAQTSVVVPAGGPPAGDPSYGDFMAYRLTIERVRSYFDAVDAAMRLPGELHEQIGVEKGKDETIQGIVADLEASDPRILEAIADANLTLYDFAMTGNTVMDAYSAVQRKEEKPRGVSAENVELVRTHWNEIDRRYGEVRRRVGASVEERMKKAKAHP
jgi:hypothetical protein